MKTLILAFLISFNLFAADFCEKEILIHIEEELILNGDQIDKQQETKFTYLGDGMFEVNTPLKTGNSLLWEVAIGASCEIVYADIILP